MYTCVLIPRELSLVLTLHPNPMHMLEMSATVWSNIYLSPGMVFYPEEGEVRVDRLETSTMLRDDDDNGVEFEWAKFIRDDIVFLWSYRTFGEHVEDFPRGQVHRRNEIRRVYGCYDLIINVDGQEVRHCNWVRFLKATSDPESANVISSKARGQTFFHVVRPIKPNEELVVLFHLNVERPPSLFERVYATSENSAVSATGSTSSTPTSTPALPPKMFTPLFPHGHMPSLPSAHHFRNSNSNNQLLHQNPTQQLKYESPSFSRRAYFGNGAMGNSGALNGLAAMMTSTPVSTATEARDRESPFGSRPNQPHYELMETPPAAHCGSGQRMEQKSLRFDSSSSFSSLSSPPIKKHMRIPQSSGLSKLSSSFSLASHPQRNESSSPSSPMFTSSSSSREVTTASEDRSEEFMSLDVTTSKDDHDTDTNEECKLTGTKNDAADDGDDEEDEDGDDENESSTESEAKNVSKEENRNFIDKKEVNKSKICIEIEINEKNDHSERKERNLDVEKEQHSTSTDVKSEVNSSTGLSEQPEAASQQAEEVRKNEVSEMVKSQDSENIKQTEEVEDDSQITSSTSHTPPVSQRNDDEASLPLLGHSEEQTNSGNIDQPLTNESSVQKPPASQQKTDSSSFSVDSLLETNQSVVRSSSEKTEARESLEEKSDQSERTTENCKVLDKTRDWSARSFLSSRDRVAMTSQDLNQTKRCRERTWWPCEVCGKKFDRPSLLKRHTRTHTGEKPHACDVCGKAFSTSSSLNTHRRIHSGEKPHQCKVCGKRFTASSNLYYHRMTHNKEKPHKCDMCSKSFPTPGDLRSHMYIHNGSWPFRCDVCNRGFSKQTNLKNHMLLHSGDKPHTCPTCGKKFALLCNLKTHAKTHESSPEGTCCLQCGTILGAEDDYSNTMCRRCADQSPTTSARRSFGMYSSVVRPKKRPTDFSISKLTSSDNITRPSQSSTNSERSGVRDMTKYEAATRLLTSGFSIKGQDRLTPPPTAHMHNRASFPIPPAHMAAFSAMTSTSMSPSQIPTAYRQFFTAALAADQQNPRQHDHLKSSLLKARDTVSPLVGSEVHQEATSSSNLGPHITTSMGRLPPYLAPDMVQQISRASPFYSTSRSPGQSSFQAVHQPSGGPWPGPVIAQGF